MTALTDLGVLFQIAQMGEREYGVPLAEGGLHAGEWETSLLLAIHPDLVSMEHAEAGFTGELEKALEGLFSEGGRVGGSADLRCPVASGPGGHEAPREDPVPRFLHGRSRLAREQRLIDLKALCGEDRAVHCALRVTATTAATL